MEIDSEKSVMRGENSTVEISDYATNTESFCAQNQTDFGG